MHKLFRSAVLGIIALVVAITPALAQDQAEAPDLTKYVGLYEFEAPDYGVMEIGVAVTEDEDGLTLSAMGTTTLLVHISGEAYELTTPDFGVINIGFIVEDDGSVSAMTLDSYDFSFVALKKNQ